MNPMKCDYHSTKNLPFRLELLIGYEGSYFCFFPVISPLRSKKKSASPVIAKGVG
jgi:hypothetical protein